MEELDCVVVGAGPFGLAAAKQYLATQPEHSLAILDAQASLGGTWARERLYPDLKTNNLLGSWEYPDFPLAAALAEGRGDEDEDEDTDTDTDKNDGVAPGRHIPGAASHAYFRAYAAAFGIDRRVRLRSRVVRAEHQPGGGWVLTVEATADALWPGHAGDADTEEVTVTRHMLARRLIVATGVTSQPVMPRLPGQEGYAGALFHARDFGRHAHTLRTARRATVLGGSKYAWDAAYAYAQAGVEVDWIVRPSGRGPCWMAPPFVTPLKRWIEGLTTTRFLTWLSPCVWGAADGFPTARRLLHGTRAGRALVDAFWRVLGADALALMGYADEADRDKDETALLRPWLGNAMFAGPSFSIRNYEDGDLLAHVRSGRVRVRVAEVERLGPGACVRLADGTEVASDAFVAVTGWEQRPPIEFLPRGIERELGLPCDGAADDDDDDLLRRVDEDILSRFPRLRDPPALPDGYVPLRGEPRTPWMLHRFAAPASARLLAARDTAFAGMVASFSTLPMAHVQGLWIAAFLSGELSEGGPLREAATDEKAMDRLRYETALHSRFGRWRYPGDWGADRAPAFIFDALPYMDVLQRDLGLDPHRKRGWLRELAEPYLPPDYRGLNDEWLAGRVNDVADQD